MDIDDFDLDETVDMGRTGARSGADAQDFPVDETPVTERPAARRGGGMRMADMIKFRVLVIVIGFILVLGLAALSIRYKTVVFGASVLVTDRWFDRTVVVHEDGSFERMDQGRPLTRRMFSSHLVEDHGVRVTTTASWRSGTMYILVKARPFTDEMREARESREPAYTISLLDGRGFTIYTFNVPLYKMREVTDREGNVTMLEYRVAKALHREDFRAVKTWEMR